VEGPLPPKPLTAVEPGLRTFYVRYSAKGPGRIIAPIAAHAGEFAEILGRAAPKGARRRDRRAVRLRGLFRRGG